MGYEIFKRTGTRVETPTLSIVPDGRLAINAAASRIFLAAGIKSVILLWDGPNHRLALKAAQKGDKNAFAVSIAAANYSGSLRAKSFLSYIGWKARKREMISIVWNEKERMFEAQLPVEHLESERWGVKRPQSS
jgi:hypothetical protein